MKLSSQWPPPNLAAKHKQATQLKFFFNFPVQPEPESEPEPALKGRLRNTAVPDKFFKCFYLL